MSAAARDAVAREEQTYIPTYDEIKSMYGPPMTLNTPKEARLAMDCQLESAGNYSLIQHAWEHGQGGALGPQFMGYAALSSLAQNAMVRTCIETVADDMTRAWINITSADSKTKDGEESDKKQKLNDAMKAYCMQDIWHHAAELTGYFGGCVIFIDTGVKGDALMTPLDISEKSAEVKNFKRFTLVEPINVFPGDYESSNPLHPGYFNPSWWYILGERVHASRLMIIKANEPPLLLKPSYNFFGIPQAQLIWDYVIHFQDCRMHANRLLEKFSLTVLATDMQDILTNPNSNSSLDTRIGYMVANRTNDGVLAIDKEMEDIIKIDTPLSGVTDIVRQSMELIVAINRTPAVKLLGISPSGFNATGESDITNYNDHIESQQEKVLRHSIQKALTLLQVLVFSKVESSIGFEFASLNENDDMAIATTQKTKSDTDVAYLDRGVLSSEEVRTRLSSDKDSPYFGIDAADVPEPGDEDDDIYGQITEAENSKADKSEPRDTESVREEASQAD